MFPRIAMALPLSRKWPVKTRGYYKLLGLAVVLATAMAACSDRCDEVAETQPKPRPESMSSLTSRISRGARKLPAQSGR
jgi:hypothetical protein